MDVQGYEYEIVEGMREILSAKKALRLFIEFHFREMGKQRSIDLLATLKEYGFEITDTTIERPGMLRGSRFNKLLTLSALLEKRMTGAPTLHGHLDLSIDGIMKNEQILSGEWWAPEIFFER